MKTKINKWKNKENVIKKKGNLRIRKKERINEGKKGNIWLTFVALMWLTPFVPQ